MYSYDQTLILSISNLSCTIISFLAEFCFFYRYFSCNQASSILKPAFSLIVSCTLYSLANIMAYFPQSDIMCNVQGLIRSTAVISTALWILFLAYNIHQQYVYSKNTSGNFKVQLLANIVISPTPGTVTWILSLYFTNPHIGESFGGVMCEILPLYEQMWCIDAPVWLILIIALIFLCRTTCAMKNAPENEVSANAACFLRYPFLMSVVVLPFVFNIASLLFEDALPFGFSIFHIIITRLEGLLIALIFIPFCQNKTSKQVLNESRLKSPIMEPLRFSRQEDWDLVDV